MDFWYNIRVKILILNLQKSKQNTAEDISSV